MKTLLAFLIGLIILFSVTIVTALEAEDGSGADNNATDDGGAQTNDGSEIFIIPIPPEDACMIEPALINGQLLSIADPNHNVPMHSVGMEYAIGDVPTFPTDSITGFGAVSFDLAGFGTTGFNTIGFDTTAFGNSAFDFSGFDTTGFDFTSNFDAGTFDFPSMYWQKNSL